MNGGFPLPPFTFMLTQVKLSESGPCLIPTAGVCSSIPGSLGQVKGEVFHAGKSLHPGADLNTLRNNVSFFCLHTLRTFLSLLPVPWPWSWCQVLLPHLPVFLYHSHHSSTLGTTSFALPEQSSPNPSSYPQRSKVIKAVGKIQLFCYQSISQREHRS